MNRISLMTMSMFGEIAGRYRATGNLEGFRREYEEMMSVVSGAGFQAVDVTCWETMLFGQEYVGGVLRDHGLSVSSYIYFAEFANPDETATERIRLTKDAADAAKSLGTSVLMLVPMAHEGIEQMSPSEIRKTMVRHFTPASAYAVSLGLRPVVEDTPDLRLCLDKASEVMEVLDAVPGLELVYDSGNMILDGEDPVEYAEKFRGRIGFVHLKDVRILSEDTPQAEHMRDGTPTCAVPTGTGMIPLARVVRRLLQDGYLGGVTVEFAKDEDLDLATSLRRAKEYTEGLLDA